MSTLPSQQSDAIRAMLVQHALQDSAAASPHRVRRGFAVGALIAVGGAAGVGATVLGSSIMGPKLPDHPHIGDSVGIVARQLPEFARAQQPADALPSAARLAQNVVSPRYVGTYQGAKYYLALSGTSAKPTSIDVVIVPASSPAQYTIGGAGSLPFTVREAGHAAVTVIGANATPPAGSVRLSHSVYVTPSLAPASPGS